MVDGLKTKWASCMYLHCRTGSAIVLIWRCLIPVQHRHIVQPVRNCERAFGIFRYGKTKPKICSSQSRRSGQTQPTHERGRNTSRSWHTQRKSSKRFKRKASGMDTSITTKRTRVEQCKINAKTRSEQKRQAVFDALSAFKREQRSITKAAVARQDLVSLWCFCANIQICYKLLRMPRRHCAFHRRKLLLQTRPRIRSSQPSVVDWKR